MITKGATRLAGAPHCSTAAAHLMLFINKLSKMTFDQGMGGLFLDYYEEHIEAHKGQGLASASSPLDTSVLTETVLAEKNKTRANDTKLEKVVEQMEQQNLSLANTLKSRLGEVGALASKVAQLERDLAPSKRTYDGGGNKPPGENNACVYCKSPDHFIRDCPKKKAADEKKRADAGSSSAAI